MKLLTVLVLLAGVALGVISLLASDREPIEAREVPRELQAEPAEGNVVLAFEVEGMCCVSCPDNLRKAAREVAGVAAIAVDPAEGRVEIEASAELEAGVLAEALTFGDYVARSVD